MTNAFDQSTACLGALGGAACAVLGLATPASIATDGHVDLRHGRDWSFGWNAGVLWKPMSSTRVGAHFRSKISHLLEGTAVFSGFNPALAGAAGLITQPASAKLTLPETASFHAYRELNDRWAVPGDITWTRWNRLQSLIINFATSGNQQVTPFNWENTMRYSAGVTYKHDPHLTFRAGAAFDETPVPSAVERTPRLPDEDRIWLAVGMTYAPDDHWRFDAGYVHLIIDDTSIRNTEVNTGHTLIGEVESDVDLVSAQVVYQF